MGALTSVIVGLGLRASHSQSQPGASGTVSLDSNLPSVVCPLTDLRTMKEREKAYEELRNRVLRVKAECEKLEQEAQERKIKKAAALADREEIRKTRDAATAEYNTLSSRLEEAKSRLAKIRGEDESVLNEMAVFQTYIANAEQESRALKAKLQSKKLEIEQAELHIKEAEEEIFKREKRIRDLEGELENQEAIHILQLDTLRALSESHSLKKNQLHEIHLKTKGLQNMIEVRAKEMENMRKKISENRDRIESDKRRLSCARENFDRLTRELGLIRRNLQEKQSELVSEERRRDELKSQENQLQECLQGVIESQNSCSENAVKADASKKDTTCIAIKKELEKLDLEISERERIKNDLANKCEDLDQTVKKQIENHTTLTGQIQLLTDELVELKNKHASNSEATENFRTSIADLSNQRMKLLDENENLEGVKNVLEHEHQDRNADLKNSIEEVGKITDRIEMMQKAQVESCSSTLSVGTNGIPETKISTGNPASVSKSKSQSFN